MNDLKIAALKKKLQRQNNFVQLEVFPGIVKANLIDKDGHSHCRILTEADIDKELEYIITDLPKRKTKKQVPALEK